jgi:tRNA(Ile)-lysidine synthase TilS/MesJ
MQCNRCGNEAVLFQDYSGQYLCRNHFVADLEAKAKRTIRTHHWLRPGDHIAVAFSEDRATAALLHFLKRLTGERRDIRISTICIDEGIAGFRDCARVQEIARSLGADCACGSFETEYGTTVDEIARKKGASRACEYCRVLRHTLLDRIALARGATKIALGTSLDEGAGEVLTDVLSGNAERLILSHREVTDATVPRIRPFMDIPSCEIERYAALWGRNDVPDGLTPPVCPYAATAPERDINVVLDEYTLRHPGTRHALVNLRETLSRLPCGTREPVPVCTRCGEPGGGSCRTCDIRDEVFRGVC